MNFLYQQRGTGKTSLLIMESARTGIPIAVHSKSQVAIIKEKAEYEFGITNLPEPIVASKENCEKAGRYFIDEAGCVLKSVLGGEPVLATASDDGWFVEDYIMKDWRN